MITPEFIHKQCQTLREQVRASEAFHNTLICQQHETTSRLIRQQLLHSSNHELNTALTQYCDLIDTLKLPNVIQLEHQQLQTHRRLSVDLHSIDGIEEEIESIAVEDKNLVQLRKRLIEGHSVKTQSFDQQLENEEQLQENLLEQMSGFVKGLRDGANAFQNRLNQDQDVLKAAEKGLQVTSSKLTKTSINLSKTIDTLGWKDLLYLCGIGITMFLISLLLILIIPRF